MDEKAATPRGGRFVWHELLSTDAARSAEFYGRLFAWSLRRGRDGHPVFAVSDREGRRWPVASLVTMNGTRRTDDSPPLGDVASCWLGCVLVEEVESTARRLQAADGAVAVPPGDHVGGRHAVVADRRRALFATFAAASDRPVPARFLPADGKDRQTGYVRMPAPSCFCWDQLNTRDLEAAAEEYGDMLGWEVRRHGGDGQAPTVTFLSNGAAAAGALQMPPGSAAPDHWLPYVRVRSVERTVARARRLDAGVLVERKCSPARGCFAILEDPLGAVVAVCEPPPPQVKSAEAATAASTGAAV